MSFLEFAWLLSWPGIVLLFLLGVAFEHFEIRIFTLACLGAFGFALYRQINPDLRSAIISLILYIPIGLAWSVYRYHRFLKDLVKKSIKNPNPYEYHHDASPKSMIPTIVSWIITWPISLIENFSKDFIDFLTMFVTRAFGNLFGKMYNSAMSEIKASTKASTDGKI